MFGKKGTIVLVNPKPKWQSCKHFGHFKMFYITQKLELYIK